MTAMGGAPTTWTSRNVAENLVRAALPANSVPGAVHALDQLPWAPVGNVEAAVSTTDLRAAIANLPGSVAGSKARGTIDATLALAETGPSHTVAEAAKLLGVKPDAVRATLQSRGLDTMLYGGAARRVQRVPAAFLDAKNAVDLLAGAGASAETKLASVVSGVARTSGAALRKLPNGVIAGGSLAVGAAVVAGVMALVPKVASAAHSTKSGDSKSVDKSTLTPEAAAAEEQQRAKIVQHAVDLLDTSDILPDGTLNPTVRSWKAAVLDGQPDDPSAGWDIAFAAEVTREAGTPIGDHGKGASTVRDLSAWAKHTGHFRPASDTSAAKPGNLVVLERRDIYGLVEYDVAVVAAPKEGGLTFIGGNRMTGETATVNGKQVYLGKVAHETVNFADTLETGDRQIAGYIDVVSTPGKGTGAPKIDEAKARKEIVHRAASKLGTMEHGRTNRSKGVDKFWESAHGPSIDDSSRAWCAAFASWVFNEQGTPFVDRNGAVSTEQIRSWGINKKIWHNAHGGYKPKPGDLILFKYPPGTGRNVNHVGIVEKYNAKTKMITTIEGNTHQAGGGGVQGVHRLHHNINASYLKGFVNVFDYYKKHPDGPKGKK